MPPVSPPVTAAQTPGIQDLGSHPLPFVSVNQLATYWMVSRRYLYKLIESGALEAVKLGPRSFRVPTAAARRFEKARLFQSGSPAPSSASSRNAGPSAGASIGQQSAAAGARAWTKPDHRLPGRRN